MATAPKHKAPLVPTAPPSTARPSFSKHHLDPRASAAPGQTEMMTAAEEQRRRSAVIEQMGVAQWDDTMDERSPDQMPPNAPGADYPINIDRPMISGEPAVGATLSSTMGNWQNMEGETRYSYAWRTTDGLLIPAYEASYVLTEAEAGKSLVCIVTAQNAGGTASALSNALGPVPGAVPPSRQVPGVSPTQVQK